MGRLAFAAKITHVPSMYLSELDGPHKGCREAAIEGHREISRRCRALGVDSIVVLDSHWLVNAGYHVNCGERFKGVYTSNELPHFIRDMAYDYPGNPALGRDAHQGAVLLLDGATGEPLALANASAVTAVRTAAVTAVATDALARPEAATLAIIGTGVQAQAHLRAIAAVRPLTSVRVASRSLDSARRFASSQA